MACTGFNQPIGELGYELCDKYVSDRCLLLPSLLINGGLATISGWDTSSVTNMNRDVSW